MAQAASAAFHNSDIVAFRPPSLPVFYCPFLIFSANSIPEIVIAALSIDPFTWFHDVLSRLAAHPITWLDELLPVGSKYSNALKTKEAMMLLSMKNAQSDAVIGKVTRTRKRAERGM